ncbi:MAG TPA: crossover junction endodeoxyribonuclease RuvC [Candidatus Paceibacterota bacterium]|nr:crossover junction endodeoxyribonuclease RuvC [Candidatus Paceibacterota bacterium]
MKIIGIDPGSTRAGYGIIDFQGRLPVFIDAGILKISSLDKNERLLELYKSFQSIIKKYSLDAAGVEKLYFVKNIKTGIEVSQSRGVIILCLQEKKIPIKEYTPLEIKQGVCGYGGADKSAITKMVRSILKIEDLKQPDDVYDALGIALVTGYSMLTDQRNYPH